jgi:hypothetical protein
MKQLISSLKPIAVPDDSRPADAGDQQPKRRTYIQRHYDYTRTAGLIRTSISELLEELSRSGRSGDALSVLDSYLSIADFTSTQEKTGTLAGSKESVVGSAKSSTLAALAAKAGAKQKLHEINRQSSLPYLISRQEFINELFANVLRPASFSTTTAPRAGAARDHQRQHIEFVNSLAGSIQELAEKHKHKLSLGIEFYGAWVEAYAPPVAGSGSAPQEWDWQSSLAAAQRVFDALEDSLGRSPAAYHSLVTLLCSHDVIFFKSFTVMLDIGQYGYYIILHCQLLK